MSEAKQTERKEIGRVKLSGTQELVAFVVDSKKRHFSIVDKNITEDPLYRLAGKRCKSWRSLIVYVIVVATLFIINCIAWCIWHVCYLWWLLPTVILGVGLLVQFLDAYLPWGGPKCVNKVYEKLKGNT